MTATIDEPTTVVRDRIVGRGSPLLPDEPSTLGELFIDAVNTHRLPDALNYKLNNDWAAISSDEMLDRMQLIAYGLCKLGIRRGDKAAILAANSPEWSLSDGGCQFAGIVDVPIYTTLAPSSVRYIINDSAARVFFIEDVAAYERIADAISDCASLEKFIFFKPTAELPANAISLSELEQLGAEMRSEQPDLLSSIANQIKPQDLATLIYTSGTTGEPKGVMLSHSNIISNVIDAGEKYDFSTHDIALSVLPCTHVFERSAMYLYI